MCIEISEIVLCAMKVDHGYLEHNTRYYTKVTMIAGAHYNCIYILMSVSSTFPCFQLGSRFIGFHIDTFGFKLAVPSLFESTSILWNSCISQHLQK